MRLYIAVTALVFAGITVAHMAKVATHGLETVGDPVFLLTTALAIALAAWGGLLLRSVKRSP